MVTVVPVFVSSFVVVDGIVGLFWRMIRIGVRICRVATEDWLDDDDDVRVVVMVVFVAVEG